LRPVQTLIQQGRYAQAEAALRSMPARSGETDYLLGFTLIQLYRFDEAEQVLRRAVEDQPANLDRLHALSKSLLEQGKNLAAIEILDRALAVASRPDLHFARAMCALNAGRAEEAERDLRASLAGQGKNPEALFKLGRLELDRGNFAEARGRFAAALAIAPQHLEARFSLAVAELRSGNAAGAIGSLEQVLDQVPGHVGALYNLARAFQASKRSEEARSTLERFRKMSAAQDEADYLQQAVKKNPQNIDGRLALVAKLLEIGQAESALREALVARQLGPERAGTYHLLAEALARLGRTADAEQARGFARRLEGGGQGDR
jgi:tetratricopeptide (TPR) repeat protein